MISKIIKTILLILLGSILGFMFRVYHEDTILKKEVGELRQTIIEAQIALEDSQRIIKSYNWGVRKMEKEKRRVK